MATISEMVVKITTDNSGLNKGLGEAEKKIDGIGKQTKSMGEKFGAAKVEVLAAAAAFTVISAAVLKSVDMFAEAEASVLRLNAATKMNGIPNATDEILDLATALQKATGADGDLVTQLGAQLISQGKTLAQTKKIITAASALTSVQGDLATNVTNLAGTYSGVTRELGKNHTEIKELTQDQLKNGEAVDIIQRKYGAFSDQMSGSTTVSLNRFKENMDDMWVMMGSLFAPTITDVTNGLSDFMEGVMAINAQWSGFIDGIRTSIEDFNIWSNAADAGAIKTARFKDSQILATGALDKFMSKVKESAGVELDTAKISLEAALVRAKGMPALEASIKTSLAQIAAIQIKFDSDARSAEQKIIDLRQKDIDDFIAKQDQMVANGVITEKQSLENRIAFQQKLIDEMVGKEGLLSSGQLTEIEKRKGYIQGYTDKLTALSDGDLALVRENELAATEAKKLQTTTALAVATSGYEEYEKQRQEDLKLEKQAAADALAAKVQANKDFWAEVQTNSDAAFKVVGALSDALGMDVGDGLGKVQNLASGAIKIFANPLDVSAWADVIASTIGIVKDGISAITGAETEADRVAREQRAAAKLDIETKSAQRLATKVEALRSEMNVEIAKARAVGASTRDIEIYYAREIARAKLTENRAVIAEQKKIQAQEAQIMAESYEKTVASFNAKKAQIEKFTKGSQSLGGDVLSRMLDSAKRITDVQLLALETSLALFSDRAEAASSNVSRSLVDGLKTGSTKTDFRMAILEMLNDMAVQAAIIATGIGDRFNEIGAFIAESLRDGVLDGLELNAIDDKIGALYDSAVATIQPINDMFTARKTPTSGGTGGATAGDASKVYGYSSGAATVNIYSPIAVNPSQAAAIFKQTAQQMAFTGAF